MQFSRRTDVVWCIYLVLAVIGVLVLLGVDAHYPYEHTAQILDGSIRRPFRYRILVPYLIQATVLGGRALGLDLPNTAVGHFLHHDFGVQLPHVELALWTAVWGVLLTWATLGLLRKLFCEWFDVGPLAAFFMPVVYLPFMRGLSQGAFWVYDFATPLLWLIGVQLVRSRKHLALVAFCGVASLAKETVVLVCIAQFLLLYREGKLRQALGWCGAAVLCVALVRVVGMLLQDHGRAFGVTDNLIRNYLDRNLTLLGTSPILRSPSLLISFMAGMVLIFRGIRRRPAILQYVMATLPLYTVLWLGAGLFLEIRVFNELLPFLVMLAYVNMLELITERPIEPVVQGSASSVG